jgi:hypothetical protein
VISQLFDIYRHAPTTTTTTSKNNSASKTSAAVSEATASPSSSSTWVYGAMLEEVASGARKEAPTGEGLVVGERGERGGGLVGKAAGSSSSSSGGDGWWWGSTPLAVWSAWWVFGTCCSQVFLNYYQNMVYDADPKVVTR